ncbi:putative non-specific serine/threonine protein kinase [Helianthus annuus]|nr:putative non-specific serine/threonine protein kinase [Helianthus annuus]KAJ0447869.1 putative non-specific serine/threonine protein kinase [Helianthus annuus]KAJ0632762.1 putative non-specific serine/threonine protein kinase [Helianthus annuus]KAJ0813569.1 putative non-specific serine/threonine protein kinase [Helianthus annuus]KAJ0826712.1 putative non-specific serine/threonine protein kinase [Helianthus annuus]
MSSHLFSFSYLCVLTIFTFFHCSLSDQNSTSIQCIGYERTALLEFKTDLIDGANRLVSWNRSNADCCNWYGITCNNLTSHVSEIRLRGPDSMADLRSPEALIRRFGGKVNPSLQNLTSLEYLDLSCNNFGGDPIPSYIGSLRNLTYLNLTESRFSGEVPSQLGDLSKLRVLSIGQRLRYSGDRYIQRVKSLQWLSGLSFLRHLDMSGVQLGNVFDWLQVIRTLLPSTLVELHLSNCGLPPITPRLTMVNLSSLSVLDLSYNNFSTDLIPSWITGLQSLGSLNLASCYFNGLIPAGLMNMNSLTVLDLSNNQLMGIQDTQNSSTQSICNLREINLNSNKFDGKSLLDVLTSLFECESSKLEFLSFAWSGLSGNLPPQLGNLKNLVHIYLGGNSISGSIPDSIGNLSSLQTLEFRSNLISGSIPDSIGRLSSLLSMNLRSNSITGPLPESLGDLSALEVLDLAYNEINGTLPRSIGSLTKLTKLIIEHNLLTGVVTEGHFANLTSLDTLRGVANTLRLEISADNWEPPFQLRILTLTSWSLGPKFPSWLENQTNLSVLYLGSTQISDNIPSWFWSTFSGLQYLNISDNNLSSVSPNDFLCPKKDVEPKQIIYMHLGKTNLSGVLPDCWTNWEFLNILYLPNNNLTGEFPRSLANLSSLESLNMHNNKLSGELPINLMNLKSLQILDLSANNFVGGIPISAGGEATILKHLSLRSNKLTGEIPDEICRLDSIQMLDLADNNLSGRIPTCFNNFSVMTGKVTLNPIVGLAKQEFMGSAWLVMMGRVYGYGSILGLVTYLDLSSNDLHGVIPSEITKLVGLRFLNLSNNRLTGRIPNKIGDMKLLQLLDLSSNQLNGMIPSSMSELSFLNLLNLSYNNLTGRIPSSTQFQSFQESSFVGNQLCGAPLSLRCERQEGGGGVNGAGEIGENGGSDGPDWGLIISILVGFLVGFWVVVAPLVASKSWRIKYFEYLYNIWFKFCGSLLAIYYICKEYWVVSCNQ